MFHCNQGTGRAIIIIDKIIAAERDLHEEKKYFYADGGFNDDSHLCACGNHPDDICENL